MYHPSYKGPTAAALAQGQVLDYDDIFNPPENQEWIIAHSDRQQAELTPKRKAKKKLHAQID